jgi:hypothetical protein
MATEAAFRAWYIRVRGLELGCVLSCMGRAMQSSGALQNWPAQGSQPPDAMQKCLLLEMLANARLKIDDISTDAKYKKQDDDWWQEQGFRLIARLKVAFGGTDGAGGDPGKVTASMLTGHVLGKAECNATVVNPLFTTWEAHVSRGNFEEAKAMLVTTSEFGRTLQRAALTFSDAVEVKVESGDFVRPRLNFALAAYCRLESASITKILDSYYPRSAGAFPEGLVVEIKSHLVGFSHGQLRTKFVKAVCLLLGSAPGLAAAPAMAACSPNNVAKAIEVSFAALHVLLADAGENAALRAKEVMNVWAEEDAAYSSYANFYPIASGAIGSRNKPGAGAEDVLLRVLFPVLEKWSTQYWSFLRKAGEIKTEDAPKSLDSLLERREMRYDSEAFQLLVQDAEKCRSGHIPSQPMQAKRQAGWQAQGCQESALAVQDSDQEQGGKRNRDRSCPVCGMSHQESKCWTKFPHLNPAHPEFVSKAQRRRLNGGGRGGDRGGGRGGRGGRGGGRARRSMDFGGYTNQPFNPQNEGFDQWMQSQQQAYAQYAPYTQGQLQLGASPQQWANSGMQQPSPYSSPGFPSPGGQQLPPGVYSGQQQGGPGGASQGTPNWDKKKPDFKAHSERTCHRCGEVAGRRVDPWW